jgi:anti-sigma factor RsiW
MIRWWRSRRGDEVDCAEVARILQQHLDGELDEESARAVSRHLEACLRCGMEASTYRELKRQLARARRPPDAEAIARLREFADELTVHS